MALCGENLAGILNTRPDNDTPAKKLAKLLGKVFEVAPHSTKLQWPFH
jgi:hypothetical protein